MREVVVVTVTREPVEGVEASIDGPAPAFKKKINDSAKNRTPLCHTHAQKASVKEYPWG